MAPSLAQTPFLTSKLAKHSCLLANVRRPKHSWGVLSARSPPPSLTRAAHQVVSGASPELSPTAVLAAFLPPNPVPHRRAALRGPAHPSRRLPSRVRARPRGTFHSSDRPRPCSERSEETQSPCHCPPSTACLTWLPGGPSKTTCFIVPALGFPLPGCHLRLELSYYIIFSVWQRLDLVLRSPA